MTAYKVVDGYGNTLRVGTVEPGDQIGVNRLDGERLVLLDGEDWTEHGAYAGPDSIEAQPGPPVSDWDVLRAKIDARSFKVNPDELSEDSGGNLADSNLRASSDDERTRGYDYSPGIDHRGVCASPNCDCVEPCVNPEAPTILQEAQAAVYGERETSYGHPRDDFARIAALWNGFMIARFGPEAPLFASSDVPHMMSMLKQARLIETLTHRDSITDWAGYAACYARVVGVDK